MGIFSKDWGGRLGLFSKDWGRRLFLKRQGSKPPFLEETGRQTSFSSRDREENQLFLKRQGHKPAFS